MYLFIHYFLQGMNEIIGPLYNVFASDTNKQWQRESPSICFSLTYFWDCRTFHVFFQ